MRYLASADPGILARENVNKAVMKTLSKFTREISDPRKLAEVYAALPLSLQKNIQVRAYFQSRVKAFVDHSKDWASSLDGLPAWMTKENPEIAGKIRSSKASFHTEEEKKAMATTASDRRVDDAAQKGLLDFDSTTRSSLTYSVFRVSDQQRLVRSFSN